MIWYAAYWTGTGVAGGICLVEIEALVMASVMVHGVRLGVGFDQGLDRRLSS